MNKKVLKTAITGLIVGISAEVVILSAVQMLFPGLQ